MTIRLPEEFVRSLAEHWRPRLRQWASPGAMARELEPRTVRTTAMLDLLDAHLVKLADGAIERLMWFCPPQEGKSQRISRWFVLWMLAHDPTLNIGIVSYELEKAVRWGRQIRRDIETHPELGITLRPDVRAAGRFETTAGGSVYCVGIGGALTGSPIDILVVDDPVKGRAEAESAAYREAAWDWWESTGETRLSERYRILLVMTRWHEDDIAGRLLGREGDEWVSVRIPAIAESNDPLGREPGQELESVQKRRTGWFYRLKAKRSGYVWNSVYQQTPVAAEGNLFKRATFHYWHRLPNVVERHGALDGARVNLDGRPVSLDDCYRFATVDLAASVRTSADYTVAAAWAISVDGDLILLDRVRQRVVDADHWSITRPLVDRWSLATVYVEAAWIGTTMVIQATSAGVHIEPLKAETDKLTRAIPAANKCAQHQIWFPADVAWLDEWCDELAAFPTGVHDDQVDVLAYATRVVAAHWFRDDAPGAVGSKPQNDDVIGQAYAADVGRSAHASGYMHLEY